VWRSSLPDPAGDRAVPFGGSPGGGARVRRHADGDRGVLQRDLVYASAGDRLLRDDHDPRTVKGITRSYVPGPWIYLAATLVAFVSPTASVVLFGAVAAFYVVESSWFGRSRTKG
jgi:hypothetical protein